MTGRAAAGIRGFAARAGAATPPHRDRAVDALRALAIAGVILGHWLVTALVPGPRGMVLRDESPLAAMPALAPLSWVFQTLAVFFFVGGYAAARGYRGGYRRWLRQRLARLTRPVAMLAAVWAPLAAALWLADVPAATLRTVLTLVADPLWFIGVYAILTAATPLAVAAVRRLGAAAALPCVAVVAGADAVRFGLGGPAWVGWVNVLAAWMVPYLLGIASASGHALGLPGGRKTAALMLAGGAAATAALIGLAGYPASMVGVNGAAVSNLNPPTLAAVTFGIAQVGLALLLYRPLTRWMRRPVAWAAVAAANLSAMTLFLWHQSAFLAVTAAGLDIGRLPGLHTVPAGPLWIAERLGWLPAFCAALAACWLLFRRAERPGGRRRRQSGNDCSAESGTSGRAHADGGTAQAPRPGRAHDATMTAATGTGSGFVNWHAAISGAGAGGPRGRP
jgi:fucose 4-O-acetylase-like acetyltransferase